MKIRDKIACYTAAVAVLTTLIMAALSFFLQKDLINERLADARRATLSDFTAACRQAVAVNSELVALNFVKLLQDTPGVAYAYFADETGKIVAHTEKAYIYKPVDGWARPPGVLEDALPVVVAERPRGAAVVGFSRSYQEELAASALRRTVRRVGAAAGAVVALGAIAAFFVSRRVTRPLQTLAEGARSVAQGRFDTRVDESARDELGDLARRFNGMAAQLAVLDELKDEFISSVSHDLRNPLSAIEMYAQALLDEPPDGKKIDRAKFLHTIVQSAQGLHLYVTNILDAAKIKAGRMKYVPTAVEVEAAAQRAVALFGIVARRAGVTLAADIPLDLPKITADSQRFDQVVANLLSNALKFTPSGGRVTLRARAEGGRVSVSVEDTGRGIPPEKLAGLFGRFQQVQQGDTVKGTGLGLYLVRKTVEDMGGEVVVSSAFGQGTTFTVTLPAA